MAGVVARQCSSPVLNSEKNSHNPNNLLYTKNIGAAAEREPSAEGILQKRNPIHTREDSWYKKINWCSCTFQSIR